MNIRNGATSRKRSTPPLARGRRARRNTRVGRFKRQCGWSSATDLECSGAISAGVAGARYSRPSLAQPNGLVHTHEEPLFTVIAPPPPLRWSSRMHAAAICQVAPFLRDLLECMRGSMQFRHGEAVSGSASRCGIVSGARATDCSLLSAERDYAPMHGPCRSPLPRQARRLSLQHVQASAQASRGGCMPENDPPGWESSGGQGGQGRTIPDAGISTTAGLSRKIWFAIVRG